MSPRFARSVQLLLKYLADTLEVNIHEVDALSAPDDPSRRTVQMQDAMPCVLAKATAAFEGIFAKLQTQAEGLIFHRLPSPPLESRGVHHRGMLRHEGRDEVQPEPRLSFCI